MSKKTLNEFKKELKELLTKYQVTLGVDIEGDTHGIQENFVLTTKNEGTVILNHYSAYLHASDL